jgi:hypothetical protein
MHIAGKYASQMYVEFYQIARPGKIIDKFHMGGVDRSVDLCSVLRVIPRDSTTGVSGKSKSANRDRKPHFFFA